MELGLIHPGLSTRFTNLGGSSSLLNERFNINTLPVLTAIVALCIGFLSLVGWAANVDLFVQPQKDMAPIAVNAAICVVGVAALALFKQRGMVWCEAAVGFFVLTLSALTLFEHATGISLGIDQLVLRQDIHTGYSYPGRMAPNAALCFFCLGLSGVIAAVPYASPDVRAIGMIVNMVALSIAGFAIYGYLFGVEAAYGWGRFTEMSLYSSLAILATSVSVISSEWQRYRSGRNDIVQITHTIRIISAGGIAILAIVSTAVGTLTLYDFIQDNDRAHARNILLLKREQVSEYLDRVRLTAKYIGTTAAEGEIKESVPLESNSHPLLSSRTLRDVAGIVTFDRSTDISKTFGEELPARFRRKGFLRRPSEFISAPISFKGHDYFILRSSAWLAGERKVFVLMFRAASLFKLLETSAFSGHYGRLILGVAQKGERRFYEVNHGKVAGLPMWRADPFAVNMGLRRGSVISLPGTSWMLIMTKQGTVPNRLIERQLLESGFLILMLALLGTAFFSGYIKTLLGYLISLQGKLRDAAQALQTELTGRARAEGLARRQAVELQSVVDNAADGIVTFDDSGVIYSFNRRAEHLFGSDATAAVGSNIKQFLPSLVMPPAKPDGEVRVPAASLIISPGVELRGRRADNSEFPLELSLSEIVTEEATMYTAIVHDITLRKRAEGDLERSVKEKETLLKEIHHRVKNNLQVISSILSLQSRRTEDPAALEVLKQSQGRILSIALLHETLYRSNDFTRIDMSVYLQEIVKNLLRSYAVERDIEIIAEADGVYLDIDRAIPCGLILNEVLSNAFKHAFPQNFKSRKMVSVAFTYEAPNLVKLEVSDNGVGLQNTPLNRSSGSLGFKLLETLCKQINGDMEIGGNPGTKFLLRFASSKVYKENAA